MKVSISIQTYIQYLGHSLSTEARGEAGLHNRNLTSLDVGTLIIYLGTKISLTLRLEEKNRSFWNPKYLQHGNILFHRLEVSLYLFWIYS